MSIRVSYGAGNERDVEFVSDLTAGCIRTDRSLQASLGFSPEAVLYVDDVEVPDHTPLRDGDRVKLFTRANTKG